MKKIILVVLIVCLLGGCNKNDNEDENMISYIEAKEKIINEGAILVDLRSSDEYEENHIDGSISLPVDTIDNDSLSETISDKNTIIIVYDDDGQTCEEAINKLNDIGYDNVYMLGSISNWEE